MKNFELPARAQTDCSLMTVTLRDIRYSNALQVLTEGPCAQILDWIEPLVERQASFFVLGGFVRQAIHKIGRGCSQRAATDLDVVGFFKAGWRGRVATRGSTMVETPLGGIRLLLKGKNMVAGIKWIDIWDVRDNINVRLFRLKPSVENVVLGGPLNLDRIAFDVRTNMLMDGGCLDGLKREIVTYDPIWEYLPYIQLFRACLLCERLNFKPDRSVLELAQTVNWRRHRAAIGNYLRSNGYHDAKIKHCENLLSTWVTN
ncbi:MAG: hypothetical protein ACLQU4_01105 [Limisphaerales bacterium]